MFLSFKNHLIKYFIGYFESSLGGLLFAMLLGDDAALLPLVSHHFKIIGMQHVVVASGFNVGLMLGIGKVLFSRFWGFHKVLCLVSLLIFYVSMAGLSPSLVRATLQASIALMGGVGLKKRVPAFWGLVLTLGFVSVFVRQLLSEVSFQFSVLSTVAVLLADVILPLDERIRETWWGSLFVETAQLTTVVQLCTLPVVWFYFGSVSWLTLPANTLLLWLTPFLTYLALIAAVVGSIEIGIQLPFMWESIHVIFRAVGWVLGNSFLKVAELLAAWESSVVTLPPFHWIFALTWYGVLLVYILAKVKTSRRMYLGLLCQ